VPGAGTRLRALLASPWAWAAVALLVRLLYLVVGPGFATQPYSDSVDYHRLAAHLAGGKGFTLGTEDALYPTTFRPPLLPFLLAPLYALFGPRYLVALLFQIVLSALTVPLAARLAHETLGARAARWTAPLLALWPPLVFFTGALLTETLAALLVVLALLLAARAFLRGGAALAIALGIALGLAALARPTALPLAAGLALWLLLAAPRVFARRALEVALVCAGLLLATLPWIARNHAVTGAWIPITSGGGAALDDSNNPIVVSDPRYRGGALSLRQVPPYDSLFQGKSELGIDRAAGARARTFLAEHRELWPRMVLWKLARFFRPTAETPATGRATAPGSLLGRMTRRLDPLLLSWGILLPFFAVGWAGALGHPRTARCALALAVLVQAALAMVYWGSLRMRLPVEPAIVILGAGTLAAFVARVRGSAPGRSPERPRS